MHICIRFELPAAGKTSISWTEGKYSDTHHKNSYILSQNSGSETTSWYVDSVAEGMVGLLASRVSVISFSAPGASRDGEGDSTTLGMRWCLALEPPLAGVPSDPPRPLKGLEGGALGAEAMGDGVLGVGAGSGAAGSQCVPGLSIKLTVSPSLIAYSLRSFESASALPLSRSRWISAGGADGCAASWALIDEILSVGCTESVNDAGGLSDLNVRDTEATLALALGQVG